jgi:general secretion pathway protein D
MKTIQKLLVATALLACNGLQAQETQLDLKQPADVAAPTPSTEGETNSLRLNFRGVALEAVLNYLSEAAGYIIVVESQPRGKVDVWSEQSLSKEEALDVLNSALLKNGYAAIRHGRTLTIVRRDEAKTRSLAVKLGGKPAEIPQTDELVTQIVPVRFTEAAKLLPVLQPLVTSASTMTANESANTIVITDTQANIHRLAQVIEAVDGGAEDFTVVKVFHLRNANSSEMADVLSQLFPDDTRSQSGSSPMQVGGSGGFPGGPGGGFPGGPGFATPGFGNPSGSSTSTGNQEQRLRARAKVTAVADQRTQALVVTASRDMMPQIEAVVTQLDMDPAGKQGLAVYHLKNASATALAKVLQDAFQKTGSSSTRNTSTQTDALDTRAANQNQQYNTSTMAGSGRSGGLGQSGLGGGASPGAGIGGQ